MVAISSVEWRPGLALAAASLPAGATKSLQLKLTANTNYAFIATADNEAVDVDLYLRDSTGQILFQDQEADGTPVLEFHVPATGNYQVQVHLVAGDSTTNFVAVSLLQSSGRSVIERDYRILTNRFFTAASALQSTSETRGWFSHREGWPVLGFILSNNTPTDLSNLNFPAGDYKIIGSGNQAIRDLSLYLANSQGDIVSRSDVKGPYPLLGFNSPEEQSFSLRIIPKGVRKPELILLGALQY